MIVRTVRILTLVTTVLHGNSNQSIKGNESSKSNKSNANDKRTNCSNNNSTHSMRDFNNRSIKPPPAG